MTNQEKLNRWCRLVHGRTAHLAETLKISRQTLWNYRTPSGRLPSAELAAGIELWTDSAVPAADWADQLDSYEFGQLCRALTTLGCVDAAGLPDPSRVAALVTRLSGQFYGDLRMTDRGTIVRCAARS